MKEKIKKLLGLCYLKKDALEKIADGFVRAHSDTISTDARHEIVNRTLDYCESDSFIALASQNFLEVFSEDDIDFLIAMYESNVMQKFIQNSSFLSDCIYKEIARFVKDIVSISD